MQKQVLIRPLWDMGRNNQLFKTVSSWAMTRWRDDAAKLGISLDTWDTMPLARADCIWLMDLPDEKSELLEARRQARPGVPFVLQVMESPVTRKQNWVAANCALTDYVVTYDDRMAGAPNHFCYRLPRDLTLEDNPIPFAQRGCAVMVNSNRTDGLLALRNRGLVGLPGIGRKFSGWKTPWWQWIRPAHGELYSWRRQLARTAERIDPAILAVHGPGWNGERISWCPFLYRRPFRCRQGDLVRDKMPLISRYRFCIAVENFRGSCGYISEKPLDAIQAGTVPVYLGEERMTDVVPAAAFVDVRDFRSHRELLLYLRSCPEPEWRRMVEAGRNFIRSERAREFSTDWFASRMNEVLLHVLGARTNEAVR